MSIVSVAPKSGLAVRPHIQNEKKRKRKKKSAAILTSIILLAHLHFVVFFRFEIDLKKVWTKSK